MTVNQNLGDSPPLGTNTQGWRQALNAFVIACPNRIDLTTLT
jgi:hypothetical protein